VHGRVKIVKKGRWKVGHASTTIFWRRGGPRPLATVPFLYLGYYSAFFSRNSERLHPSHNKVFLSYPCSVGASSIDEGAQSCSPSELRKKGGVRGPPRGRPPTLST
jgi:hypothetical protein